MVKMANSVHIIHFPKIIFSTVELNKRTQKIKLYL